MSPTRVGLAVLLICLATAAAAQAPPPVSFAESLDIRVAGVEVLVTDRDGQPVPGLTRDDFQVLEDGRTAEVSNVAAAAPQPLVLAVFLDDTSLSGAARSNALAGLRRFLATGLKPGDRVLVARWDGNLAIQGDPTGDAATLGALLDRLGTAPPSSRAAIQERNAIARAIRQTPPLDGEKGNALALTQAEAAFGDLRTYAQTRADGTRAALDALQKTFALLAGLAERKVLLYVGGGLPQRPGADLLAAWQKRFGMLSARLAASPFEIMRLDATPQVQQTADRANAAGVSIYAVVLPESGAASAEGTASPEPDPEDAGRALRTLAAGTGGRVTTGVQNPAGFLAGTERDLAGAYSLGYTPPPGSKPGRHKIEIRVRGGALHARYREERFDGETREAANPLLQRALAVLWGAGDAANPLRVELAVEEETAEKDGRLKVTAVASLPLSTLTLQPQEHYHVAHLTLAIASRDGGGKVAGVPHAEIPVEIPNERLLAAPGEAAGYRFTLHLAPGESVVAVAVRDDFSGAESALRAVYKGLESGFAASPGGSGSPDAPPSPATTAVDVLPSPVRVESAALLLSGQEGGEIPLNALALSLPGEEGKTRVLVRMRMDGPALLAGQIGNALRIETALYALEAGGGVEATLLETIGIDLATQRPAIEHGGVDFLGSLDLKPGAYSLRLLARNAATGHLGVRTFPLTVLDPRALEALPLSPPPAVDPRPTARASGLGPLDPPAFQGDAAPPPEAAAAAPPPPPAIPDTVEGRRLRGALRTAYRDALARLAAGRDAEAVAAVASLTEDLFRRAGPLAAVEQLVEIETGAARELAAADPESLVPVLRLQQRLYEEATARRRQGAAVAYRTALALLALYREHGPELARRFTTTLGVELLRGGLSIQGGQLVQRTLADDPADEIVLLELAVAAEKRADRAGAVARFETLLAAHPDNPEARLRLAIDLARLGRRDEARDRLNAVLRDETAGWRLSLAFQELARMQLANGEFGAAERTLREGLQRLPGDEKLTLLLTGFLERTVGGATAREALAAWLPEGKGGGGAARHRYNLLPAGPLEAALADLDREAAARFPALARALEKTAP